MRVIKDYVKGVNKNTEIFSTYDPEVLFNSLMQLAQKKGYTIDVSSDQYKAKLAILT